MHTRTQHKNARMTPLKRREMVSLVRAKELTREKAAEIYGVHRNTISKWVKDFEESGNWLCLDKSSCPEKYRISVALKRLDKIEKKIQKRLARDRIRYVKDHPGQLIHIDTKKLPKLTGETDESSKEYLYVAIDDATRYLYAAVMPDKTDETAAAFLEEVIATSPFVIEAVMTDNGKEYRGSLDRGHAFETILEKENIKHVYTKPYTPKTNGKAERVIGTIMSWHRQVTFKNREERNYRLTDFVDWYNTQKGHSSLNGEPPIEFLIKHLEACDQCTQRFEK